MLGKKKAQQYNENGSKLIGLVAGRGCKINRTYYGRKEIHKAPDNKTLNQIDHSIIQGKYVKIVNDIKSRRRADVTLSLLQ